MKRLSLVLAIALIVSIALSGCAANGNVAEDFLSEFYTFTHADDPAYADAADGSYDAAARVLAASGSSKDLAAEYSKVAKEKFRSYFSTEDAYVILLLDSGWIKYVANAAPQSLSFEVKDIQIDKEDDGTCDFKLTLVQTNLKSGEITEFPQSGTISLSSGKISAFSFDNLDDIYPKFELTHEDIMGLTYSVG